MVHEINMIIKKPEKVYKQFSRACIYQFLDIKKKELIMIPNNDEKNL